MGNNLHIQKIINFIVNVEFFFVLIKFIYCDNCKISNSLINTECFNNILIFNKKTYRAGSFATNKNGDIIIEYSTAASRLFFGLKQNGDYYFKSDNHTKEIEEIRGYNNIYGRYESENIFVSLEDDINKDKEYLFSVSTYISLTELYDFESNNYEVSETQNFIGKQIYSFEFPLLEAKYNNKILYFCIYVNSDNYFYIKKFGFSSFSLNYYHDIQNKLLNEYSSYSRIISSFIIEEYEILIIFFFALIDRKSIILFYDFDLIEKGVEQDKIYLSNFDNGKGIFFKAIYLKNNISILAYFKDGNDPYSLYFLVFSIIKNNFNYNIGINYEKNINENLQIEPIINDFVKLDNERLSFISTSGDFKTLYILIIDLYNNYQNMIIREYKFDLSYYKIVAELTSSVFNGYLVFSSTVESSLSTLEYYSIFILFGYPNWRGNNIIDIFSYFTDNENYDSSNNIITRLLEELTIENNIFGYIPSNKIKLISIPKEVIFYNGNETAPLSNGEILEFKYRFEQNSNIIKNNEYYSLDFQICVQEPDYTTFYNYAHHIINYPSNINDQNNNFEQKIFFGKTNTLKFKLCHDYCMTCNTFGSSNDDQQCLSCLSPYVYDYFNEYPSNCVPEGYFNDKELKKLVECTPTNSKYYINITNNKSICFKNLYNCPVEYPYLNTTSNECQMFSDLNIFQSSIPIISIENDSNAIQTIISSGNVENMVKSSIPIFKCHSNYYFIRKCRKYG